MTSKHRKPPLLNGLTSHMSMENFSAGLPRETLVYHESARSIVFRDNLRRHQKMIRKQKSSASDMDSSTHSEAGGYTISRYTPTINPLPSLELGAGDMFEPLVQAEGCVPESATARERTIVKLLVEERAVVKTIRNADWTTFLERFVTREDEGLPPGASPSGFRTSTSLLPSGCKKMRCYGSTREFTVGAVFALPTHLSEVDEDEVAAETKTWCWPSGYSAKTEFNVDNRGNLINGRQQALISVSALRRNNHSYLNDKDYFIGERLVKGGLTTVPYNELYIRVGGCNRNEVNGVGSNEEVQEEWLPSGRSYVTGIGTPIALFVRTACFSNLVSLLRTRARTTAVLGKEYFSDIPLLVITPENGVQVLTDDMQTQLFHILAQNLNPFQNPSLYKTQIDNTSEQHMQQKLEELIDINDHDIRKNLTREECVRIAGGFGATDDSVAQLLMDAMHDDQVYAKQIAGGQDKEDDNENEHNGHELQDIVNEGLVAAVRSSDYNTARQLLILYTLVATRGSLQPVGDAVEVEPNVAASIKIVEGSSPGYDSDASDRSRASDGSQKYRSANPVLRGQSFGSTSSREDLVEAPTPFNSPPNPSFMPSNALSNANHVPPPPPPPPLDTDRLRGATNSDGLLAVLGAAEVLKSMQDGSAKQRVEEAVSAIEEWVLNGEQSVAFRLASWRNQRAAQGDLKIAMEHDSNVTAFVGTHAISNRKKFAGKLRAAVANVDFENISFLRAIHELATQMHSPCLRLELLQYILGLDNRYSVAHVARSVELAATCMNISMNEAEAIDVEKENSATVKKSEEDAAASSAREEK